MKRPNKGIIFFSNEDWDAYLDLEDRHAKKEKVARILWATLGIFGAHRFYLGYYRSGLIMLVLTVFTLGLLSPIALFDYKRLEQLTWEANYEFRLWAVKEVKRRNPL